MIGNRNKKQKKNTKHKWSKTDHEKLGVTLLALGLVSEEDITISVCELMQKPYMAICITEI